MLLIRFSKAHKDLQMLVLNIGVTMIQTRVTAIETTLSQIQTACKVNKKNRYNQIKYNNKNIWLSQFYYILCF